jgi:putative transposase
MSAAYPGAEINLHRPMGARVRHVRDATTQQVPDPATTSQDALTEVLRRGAQQLLMVTLQAEVATYIDRHKEVVDGDGHRLVVRNGTMPERTIDTAIGQLPIKQPRVNDRRIDEHGERARFESSILPRYLRRTKHVEELIPWLYLRGISTSDFSEFLQKLTGAETASLSPNTVVRLKESWQQEHQTWSRRSLAGKRYVYWWVDGIHFNIRLEEGRQCILVVMGATEDGCKELIAIHDGVRESEQSWYELLVDLQRRGLERGPELAIGDGALGFWKAIAKVFPATRAQRCWVHKTVNILNKLPDAMQDAAKSELYQIWMASDRASAIHALETFAQKYEAKYPTAVTCLVKDKEELLAFYDFPAEHWVHLRTTNPLESTFATVRLRTTRTKGSGSRDACLAMVFKLAQAAQQRWRQLNGAPLIREVIAGVHFKDGIRVHAA